MRRLAAFLASVALSAAVQAAPARWTITDLGTLGGTTGATPTGINNRGDVVGYSNAPWPGHTVEHMRAFLWRNGVMQDLSTPTVDAHHALAINDRGAVVGAIGGFPGSMGGGARGFLLDDGALTMLDEIPEVKAAGWSNVIPVAINDRGWITGYGAHPSAGCCGLRAFVLVPR